MKFSFLLVVFLIAMANVLQAQIFVSPTGDDATGTGTIDLPYLTLAKAVTLAGPDSIVYMRGGTHHYTAKVTISASGSVDHYIKIWAYQNEKPVIDFTGIATNTDGISISGSYCYLKGLDIMKATHNAVRIAGHYNILEQCTFRECGNSGLLMGSNSSTANPSHNLILNCDAYKNFDPPVGGNADGMSAKWNIGVGNRFKGCRAWNNSDDGWDLWMAINPVVIDSCWSFRNGVDIWHTGSVSGNGNGIKLGGNNVATYDTVRNCLSFDNAGNTGRGFDENNNLAGQTLYNCTAFRNTGDNFHFANTLSKGSHLIRNCVSYLGVVNITSGTIDHNSWQGFAVGDADFMSLDTTQLIAPRKANGSLPDITFMHLTAGSTLIDVGMDIGMPYSGAAPDMGAFESDYPQDVAVTALPASSFALMQNFPNPFNPTTEIRFSVEKAAHTTLTVFNFLGQKVATLFNGTAETGRSYRVTFNGQKFASGVYFYRLQSGARSDVKRLILLK